MASAIEFTCGYLLRTGGFGTDYIGMNNITGEFIAVREIKKLEDGQLEDLRSSLDIMQAKTLRHQNLITHLGYTHRDSAFFILSEYVLGHRTISCRVLQYRSFEESIIRSFTSQIVQGLEHLQSEGVVHNNLNSSNIFVGYDGVVKIADFGTPHVADNSQFTHTFQSPEVASHSNESYDNKGNVWSLGVIVLEMVMGQLPSENDIKIMSEEPGNNVRIPEDGDIEIFPDCENFVRACLATNPGTRPATSDLLVHPLCVLTHDYDFLMTDLYERIVADVKIDDPEREEGGC